MRPRMIAWESSEALGKALQQGRVRQKEGESDDLPNENGRAANGKARSPSKTTTKSKVSEHQVTEEKLGARTWTPRTFSCRASPPLPIMPSRDKDSEVKEPPGAPVATIRLWFCHPHASPSFPAFSGGIEGTPRRGGTQAAFLVSGLMLRQSQGAERGFGGHSMHMRFGTKGRAAYLWPWWATLAPHPSSASGAVQGFGTPGESQFNS